MRCLDQRHHGGVLLALGTRHIDFGRAETGWQPIEQHARIRRLADDFQQPATGVGAVVKPVPALLEENVAAHFAAQRGIDFLHFGFDERMAGLEHQRHSARRFDVGSQALRAFHVINNGAAGHAAQHISGKQHHLPVGVNVLAIFGDDAQAVAIAVKSQAKFGVASLQGFDQVLQVFRLAGVGMVIGKAPPRLQSLVEEGLIDTVVRQLMSGKEAMVYVVRCGDDTRCAKIYKEADQRSFRQAVDYTENRKVKNTRQARAMAKGTKFGRQASEAAWQSAEVDALYRLADAGVRVPKPYNFCDGVLLMELVTDAHGDAAPRLNDVDFTPEQARQHHASLITEVIRMLCAGIVHGDLSEFNILLAEDGPVIIDLPQAVDAAGNNHASRMLLRDVANLRNFFGRFAPELLKIDFGHEMWDLYQRGVLYPETVLTGKFQRKAGPVDVGGVLREIDDASAQEAARRVRMGQS